ncbi:MAG: BrnT family toxin [Gammaproteobacteria bacterium]|nr:BrnT family toxin [Gammaproteobacteria bacterium]
MAVEYDPHKAAANAIKHGVTFEEATSALLDPMALVKEDVFAESESRWILLGMSAAGRLLVVVYTIRGDETVHIISARQASRNESAAYA